MKKKAIKIATATAVAASAFTASASVFAASNVGTTVDQAVVQMQKAYSVYATPAAQGKFANIADVYKQFNAAKTAYANARAAVAKAGGAQKDAYLAKLDSTYSEYVTKRVVTYIDAYNYAVKNLQANQQKLQTAINGKDLAGVEAAYNEISYQLKSRTVILDRVYGKNTRDLLRSAFKASAQTLRDSVKYDVTVSVKIKALNAAVTSGQLNDAAADAAAQINKYLPSVTATFKDTLTSQATAALAAYDKALSPAVTSVKAINPYEIQVAFNKTLDETSAKDLGNYVFTVNGFKFETAATVSGILDADVTNKVSYNKDTKTVTFRLNAAWSLFNGDKYSVDVRDGVLSADKSQKVAKYTDTQKTFSDTTAPKLVSVSKDTDGKLKLVFDEPVTNALTATVDGQAVALAAPSTKIGDYSVKSAAVLPDFAASVGTHNVSVYNATDEALPNANKVTILTGSYSVGTDTTPPAVSKVYQSDVNDRELLVDFSEPVTFADFSKIAVKKGNYTFATDAGPVPSAVGNTTYKVKTVDADTIAIDFSADAATPLNALYGSDNSATLAVDVEGYKDAVNLVGAKYSGTITMNKDVNAPSVTSIYENKIIGTAGAAATDGKLSVKFNKALAAVDASKITVTDKDGVVRTVAAAAVNGQTVEIALAGTGLDAKDELDAKASYTVSFAASAVTAANNVKNSALTTTVLPSNTVSTPVVEAVNNVAVAGSVITVTYNEAMTASATNIANYTLDNAALPAGTTISMDSTNKVVTITLPEGYTNANITKLLTISKNVTTVSGSVLVGSVATKEAFTQQIAIGDNTKPTIVKAEYQVADLTADTTATKIKLTFSENVKFDPATVAGDLKVVVNGAEQSVKAVTDGTAGDKVLWVELNNAVNLSQAATITVVKEADQADKTIGITDANGNKAQEGNSVATSGKTQL